MAADKTEQTEMSFLHLTLVYIHCKQSKTKQSKPNRKHSENFSFFQLKAHWWVCKRVSSLICLCVISWTRECAHQLWRWGSHIVVFNEIAICFSKWFSLAHEYCTGSEHSFFVCVRNAYDYITIKQCKFANNKKKNDDEGESRPKKSVRRANRCEGNQTNGKKMVEKSRTKPRLSFHFSIHKPQRKP